jgi:hypothetical protein
VDKEKGREMHGKDYAEVIGLITGLSISLEPTGWGCCNNVSRRKDHRDKRLQDYLYMGHRIQQLITSLLKKEDALYQILSKSVKVMIDEIGTNTSCGSLVLVLPNAYAAYRFGGDKHVVAEHAFSILLRMKPSLFFNIISRCQQSFVHPFSSSILPSLRDKLNPRWMEKDENKNLYTVLKNIPFDPVSKEITMAFTSTRHAADRFLGDTFIPGSRDIDRVFEYHCSKNIDYLVYRKRGLDTALRCNKLCTTHTHLEKDYIIECTMGSISDLVSLTLFYHFYDRLVRR